MEKRRKIDAVNGEIQLPEAIIQHIQSFLNGKEAAQTSVLSKSWYSAWSTRPNLDFDQREFRRIRGFQDPKSPITDDGFVEFVKKTMQRYEELKLKIDSFRLCMETTEGDSNSLANELILKSIEMGATDLNIEVLGSTGAFVLPLEVLGCENLVRLYVIGCRIDLGADFKVSCSRLKFLGLCRVHVVGDAIWDIISSCPLIEELLLCICICLSEFRSSDVVTTRSRLLELSPFTEFGKQNVGLAVGRRANLYEFRNLKCLLLENVRIDTLFFGDLSSKFPCLKDLALRDCLGYKTLQISSSSLECISIQQGRVLRAKFDVPSLRKFAFSGAHLPYLAFETSSGEWESDISITCSSKLNTSWFQKLKRLLRKLSPSRIFLSLNIDFFVGISFDYAGGVQDLPKPVVENLMLSMLAPSSVYSALLDGLFWSCRPKFVTQYRLPKSCLGGNENNEFLEIHYRTLMQQVSRNCCTPNQNMCDLEEVNLEYFEETLSEWRPLPWTFLDASTSPENKQIVRFQLQWGSEPVTFK